jgi:hypothetical protein
VIAANEIEAQLVSLCHFNSSRLIGKSRAGVALAEDSEANRSGVVDEKGNRLTSSSIFALLILCLSPVLGDSPLVTLAARLSFDLTPGAMALAEDSK